MDLSQLKRGRDARVVSVSGEPGVAVRLMELGLLPGTLVRVVRVAPMGDPMVIALRGAEVSLRSTEARLVAIETS